MALASGMTALLDPKGEADVAAIYVWVRAGSAVEPVGLEGAAHFLEHMVFKGTRSFGVGGVAAAIEDVGGDLNAFTSFDETAFHCTVPAARAPEAVRVLAEMLSHATLDPDELERERLVILEEIRGTEDDPESVIGEALWAAAFPGHPYGRPVIGSVQSVTAITRAALAEFYRGWYRPDNAVLAVAGPVDTRAVLDAAERCFAASGGPPPAAPRTPALARAGARRLLRGPFEGTRIDLAFDAGVTPGDLRREAVVDVLAGALGGGRSAPLELHLRRGAASCQEAVASTSIERDAGLFGVHLHAHAGRADEAIVTARALLDAARHEGPARGDVDRARAGLLASLASRTESVDARASDMAQDHVRHGDVGAAQRYAAAVAAVTVEEVRAAARDILDPSKESVVVLAPEREAVRAHERPPDPRRLAPAARAARPAVERHVLPNGVRVLLEPSDAPVVAARVVGRGGVGAEPARRAGSAGAWARMVSRGAGALDADALAAEVESLGGGLGGSAGLSTQAVRGDFTSGTWAQGLDLLAEVVLRPTFPADELVRVRDELRAELAERADDPEQLATERLWAGLFPDHAYGHAPGGTAASLRALSRRGLAQAHARWARPDNLVVALAGGFDPEAALRRIRRTFGSLLGLVGNAEEPDSPRVGSGVRAAIPTDLDQAHIVVAWPGVTIGDPDQPALELVVAVLGGQAGRLFLELREAHGLAYSVGIHSTEAWQSGLVVAGAAVEAARLDEAEARLVACVGAVVDGVTDAELDRARASLLGGAEAGLQSARQRAATAGLLEVYGFDGARYRSFVRERIESVTPEAFRRAAARLAAPLGVVRVEPRGT